MHAESDQKSQSITLGELIRKFNLSPTNVLEWGIAADWLEDQWKLGLLPASIRIKMTGDGDRGGDGSGDGNGNGSGGGWGGGSGTGNGYGNGDV